MSHSWRSTSSCGSASFLTSRASSALTESVAGRRTDSALRALADFFASACAAGARTARARSIVHSGRMRVIFK